MADKAEGRVGGWVVELQSDGLHPRRRYLVGLSERQQAEQAVRDLLGQQVFITATSPVAPSVLAASRVGPGQVVPL